MINWHKFWQNYRPITKTNTDDFLYQVGKTVLSVAISNEQFNSIVNNVVVGLNLNKQDNTLLFTVPVKKLALLISLRILKLIIKYLICGRINF